MPSLLNILTITLTLTSRGWTALDLVIELLRHRPNIQLQDPCDKEPKSNIVSYWKIFGQNQRNKSVKQNEKKFIPNTNTRFNIKLLEKRNLNLKSGRSITN